MARRERRWIRFEDAVHFGGPDDPAGREIRFPAADACDLLRFLQAGMLLLELCRQPKRDGVGFESRRFPREVFQCECDVGGVLAEQRRFRFLEVIGDAGVHAERGAHLTAHDHREGRG